MLTFYQDFMTLRKLKLLNEIYLSFFRFSEKNFSMVSQDVVLFDDTIKNNIAYTNTAATNGKIVDFPKFAAADEFIKKLQGLRYYDW